MIDTPLEHYGIYVQPINYPTCRAAPSARLTPSPVHTDAQLAALIAAGRAARWPTANVRLAAE